MEELKDLIQQLESKKSFFRWKKISSKDLSDFAKRTNPYKIKPSGYYFYVDTRSKTYEIILQGVKPNAGAVKGFSAPVKKKIPIKHEKVNVGSPSSPVWRTIKNRSVLASNIGVEALNPAYYGVSDKPSQFFGKKIKSGLMAFGVATQEHEAVPIYSENGLVEWVSDINKDEMISILIEAGYKALSA